MRATFSNKDFQNTLTGICSEARRNKNEASKNEIPTAAFTITQSSQIPSAQFLNTPVFNSVMVTDDDDDDDRTREYFTI